jgi:hypothetical protein
MGFLDTLLGDVLDISKTVQGFKEELVNEFIGSKEDIGELKNTVNEIAGELTGKGVPSSTDLNQKN